jgi:hypothetical protein
MELGRATVGLVVAVVLATVVVSGPLVGAVDLTGTTPGLAPSPGSGDATVEVRSVPTGEYAFERGDFGARVYHVEASPLVVDVGNVEGNPVLRYTVDVRDLSFVATREVELAGKAGRTLRIRPGTGEVGPRTVTGDRYEATVAVWVLHDGARYRQVYQGTTT